jgi:hypothetical protein
MKCVFILFQIVFVFISHFTFAQKQDCVIKLVRLEYEKSIEHKSSMMKDSILAAAKTTNNILVSNTEIKRFEKKIDTSFITNSEYIYKTTLQIVLKDKAVSRLSNLEIPLSCGIPVGVYINEKEVFRFSLWNIISSFGSETITANLWGNKLVLQNQKPNIADSSKKNLMENNIILNCLSNR